jgi:hypothetical protein
MASPDTAPRYVAALPVWGDFYVDFFHRVSLPSLLSPGNLPAFATPDNMVVLAYTRPQDLQRLSTYPAMRDLARVADIRFKALPEDIEEFSTGADGILRKLTIMSRCLEVAIRAAEDDPGLTALFPLADLVYADGSLAAMDRRIREGVRAVGVVTPHISAEAMLEIAADGRVTETVANPQRLLQAVLENPHPSFTRSFLGAEPFIGRPSQFYADGGAAGFVGRALHLHPLAVRPRVRLGTLSASIDTAYYFEAVPDAAERHLVTDSGEALVVECSRADYLADLPDWPAFSEQRLLDWASTLKMAPGQADLPLSPVSFRCGDGDLSGAVDAGAGIASKLARSAGTRA